MEQPTERVERLKVFFAKAQEALSELAVEVPSVAEEVSAIKLETSSLLETLSLDASEGVAHSSLSSEELKIMQEKWQGFRKRVLDTLIKKQ